MKLVIIPDGYVVVPREPTDAQIDITYDGQHASDIYREMVAAAPPSTFVPGVGFLPVAEKVNPEPVAYLYQHDETGRTTLVLAENRWTNTHSYVEVPLYTSPPESEADALRRQLLLEWDRDTWD